MNDYIVIGVTFIILVLLLLGIIYIKSNFKKRVSVDDTLRPIAGFFTKIRYNSSTNEWEKLSDIEHSLDSRLRMIEGGEHFYVDIGDDCQWLVSISERAYHVNSSHLDSIQSTVSGLLIPLTSNLDVETKNVIVGNTLSTGIKKGDHSLDIYNCDPYMRKNDQWDGANYEYISEINGWHHLEDILTVDGREYSSETFGLGATLSIPRTSICVYDIVCDHPSYVYESVLVHEIAHTILELGIRTVHPDWYLEFGEIVDLYNEISNERAEQNDYCPINYACDRRELFALATQAWFNLISRTDINHNITTAEEMRDISRGELSLYSFMEKIYGEPGDLCGVVDENCKDKCKINE